MSDGAPLLFAQGTNYSFEAIKALLRQLSGRIDAVGKVDDNAGDVWVYNKGNLEMWRAEKEAMIFLTVSLVDFWDISRPESFSPGRDEICQLCFQGLFELDRRSWSSMWGRRSYV